MQEDAETLQKEFDKVNKKQGTTTVRAGTNDADFEAMIQNQIQKFKNKSR